MGKAPIPESKVAGLAGRALMYGTHHYTTMPKATDTRAEVFANLFAESRGVLHRYIRRFGVLRRID